MKKIFLSTTLLLLGFSMFVSAASWQPVPQQKFQSTAQPDTMDVKYVFDEDGELVMTNVVSKDKKFRISFIKGLHERTIFSFWKDGKWIPFFVKFRKKPDNLQPTLQM